MFQIKITTIDHMRRRTDSAKHASVQSTKPGSSQGVQQAANLVRELAPRAALFPYLDAAYHGGPAVTKLAHVSIQLKPALTLQRKLQQNATVPSCICSVKGRVG